MKILIALTYYRPHYSGLTIYTERVAQALAKRGHQITILTSRYAESLPEYERTDGVEVRRVSVLARISKGVIMPSMPYWAWKLIREIDVVHLHVPQLDAALISMMARIRAKPVVLTYHCDLRLPTGFSHSIANRVSNFANHITASLSNIIVQNTRDYAENSHFLNRYLNKIKPVFPPVDILPVTDQELLKFRQKFAIMPDQRIIGMAARLASEKGVEYLAMAMPHVLEKFPNSRVLFVGPYENILGEELYAARLAPIIGNLNDHWSFLGILTPSEMGAFYNICELTVLPSINSTESYGIVQVESMGYGTPVVATDLPGVRIPIELSEMGCIVSPADSEGLAEAIITTLKNPNNYRGHPQSLLKLSTPDSIAIQYENLFRSLLTN